MNTQQVLICHVQLKLPNATTRLRSSQICKPSLLASCKTLASKKRGREASDATATPSTRLVRKNPTQFLGTETPSTRDRREGQYILTALHEKLHVAVLVPLVEHVHGLRVVGLGPRDQLVVPHLPLNSISDRAEHNN